MKAILILALGYLIYTFHLIAENPQSKVVTKRVECEPVQCPVVPREYFIVKTKEEVMCQTESGRSVVYKSIEQSKVE